MTAYYDEPDEFGALPRPIVASQARCRNCAGGSRFIDGLCWRCFDSEAPRGFEVCRACGYERAKGLPCGEPCV